MSGQSCDTLKLCRYLSYQIRSKNPFGNDGSVGVAAWKKYYEHGALDEHYFRLPPHTLTNAAQQPKDDQSRVPSAAMSGQVLAKAASAKSKENGNVTLVAKRGVLQEVGLESDEARDEWMAISDRLQSSDDKMQDTASSPEVQWPVSLCPLPDLQMQHQQHHHKLSQMPFDLRC